MDINGGALNQFGMEKLTNNNYQYWRMCMKAYLQGQDLWDIVDGGDTDLPPDTPENSEARRKWKIKCGKALFALRGSIHKDLIDHIRDKESPKDVWDTLDKLFTKKNTARLQFLENELANTNQGSMTIAQYFQKVKSLCAEISELDPDEPIKEARMRRYLIRGIKKEYTPFLTSIQGWANQPSIVELENLLTNQEALEMQMAKASISENDEALFVRKQRHNNYNYKSWNAHNPNGAADWKGKSSSSREQWRQKNVNEHRSWPGKNFKQKETNSGNLQYEAMKKIICNRCGKPGHIKKFCRSRFVEGNASISQENSGDWETCLSIETTNLKDFVQESALTSIDGSTLEEGLARINYSKDWIIDSGCSHHLTGDESLFSKQKEYTGDKAIVTADNSIHPVKTEGNVKVKAADGPVNLTSVYHVPGMTKNLISVSQLTNSGRYVLFGPNDFKILENIKSIQADTVLKGKRVNSLYVLSASEAFVEKTSRQDKASLWHARLAHVSYEKLKNISENNIVNGLPTLGNIPHGVVCEGCQYGKAHRLPFGKSSIRSTKPLQLIHSDLLTSNAASYGGLHYMLVIVDDYTRFSWVFFMKEKSDTFLIFKQFKRKIEGELRRRIKCLRTDNGGEFTSNEFADFCERHGIRRQFTCPRTSQQNGVAERKLRHLQEVSRSWMHSKSLPQELWAEAMRCACHVINRLPSKVINMKTPYELLYKEKPSVSYFRIFGSVCYVHVSDQLRAKMDAKAQKCVFVGYDPERKGWRCMDPHTLKVVTSRDVVFDEISSYYVQPILTQLADPSNIENEDNEDVQDRTNPPHDGFASESETTHDDGTQESDQLPRRSERRRRRNEKYKDYTIGADYDKITECFFAGPFDDLEPSSYEDAKGSPNWEAAMKEEMSALHKNETWDLVPKPKGVKPISCKWVYKVKRKSDGSVDRYKARLVARGFSQKYGLDYEETFSPVAKMTSVRATLSMAASKGWKLWQLDVKNAFLYGDIDREIYMEQPSGFKSKKFPDYVCRLKKAIYGLKQAPRAWFGKIAQYLTFCGYASSSADASLFIKKDSKVHVLVLLYVDDMIITGNDEQEINRLKDELAIRFEMKNLGELKHFLGLEVSRCEEGILVSQSQYAKKILEKFKMINCRPAATPMEQNLKLRANVGKELKNVKTYRTLVGSLIYLTITRPDISFPVGVISQFMQKPRKPHLDAANRILRYLKHTMNYGLMYKQGAEILLSGFTDADWAGDPSSRRSTSGYTFDLGSAAISWCSKKQATVALSSTEAEYNAATVAAQECVWLTRLIKDISHSSMEPVELYCDNMSSIRLASNPVFHARTKHIEVHYHFIREKVLEEEIDLIKIDTSNQVADIFTKALPKAKFDFLRAQLGLVSEVRTKGEC